MDIPTGEFNFTRLEKIVDVTVSDSSAAAGAGDLGQIDSLFSRATAHRGAGQRSFGDALRRGSADRGRRAGTVLDRATTTPRSR